MSDLVSNNRDAAVLLGVLEPGKPSGDSSRARELFRAHQQRIFKRTDRVFVHLMLVQWIAVIVFALWVSPSAWAGTGQSEPTSASLPRRIVTWRAMSRKADSGWTSFTG